jgi:LysM repeat protein
VSETIRPGHSYVVQAGDTLESIATKGTEVVKPGDKGTGDKGTEVVKPKGKGAGKGAGGN